MTARGTFLWNELLTDDPAVAGLFYSDLSVGDATKGGLTPANMDRLHRSQ